MLQPRHLLALLVSVLAMMPTSVRAVDPAMVELSIKKGVAHLRTLQEPSGRWPMLQSGATSLAALTLLECGVPANDPAILRAADHLRQESLRMTETYSVALAVLFLDRLGDNRDIPLLESLVVRLLAGQGPDGGWGYTCPPIADTEVARLSAHLKRRNELRAGPLPGGRRSIHDLPREIQQQIVLINRMGGVRPGPGGGLLVLFSDNSNTQFATLGLWVARKYGIPVDGHLRRVENRFRLTQNANGTWSYAPQIGGLGLPPVGAAAIAVEPSAAMTCAGVLALAASHATAPGTDLNRDGVLQKGLAILSEAIGEPGGRAPVIGQGNGKAYYFLWSLERVGVALNLDTLGGKDWYSWGAEVLLANQQRDGSWRGDFHSAGADTCFALLFLKKANLAHDLSASLRGRMKDVTLRSGGVGAVGLPGVKSALAREDRKPAPEDPRKKNPPKLAPIPARPEDQTAEKLSEELLTAAEEKRSEILNRFQNSKGPEHTEALALAIPRLTGKDRDSARDVLQMRLRRFTAATLLNYMDDSDPEIRAAALLAAAAKPKEQHGRLIPRILEALADRDPYVARAAQAALKVLTGQDFNPPEGAGREEIEKAMNQYRDWWKKNSS